MERKRKKIWKVALYIVFFLGEFGKKEIKCSNAKNHFNCLSVIFLEVYYGL